jgi:ABC-type multidrug transport system fused ATPase/permease subunit
MSFVRGPCLVGFRFYAVEHGEILVGGRDIKSYNPLWLRQNFALVGQEPVLFRRSVKENLTYGCIVSTPTDQVFVTSYLLVSISYFSIGPLFCFS